MELVQLVTRAFATSLTPSSERYCLIRFNSRNWRKELLQMRGQHQTIHQGFLPFEQAAVGFENVNRK